MLKRALGRYLIGTNLSQVDEKFFKISNLLLSFVRLSLCITRVACQRLTHVTNGELKSKSSDGWFSVDF